MLDSLGNLYVMEYNRIVKQKFLAEEEDVQ
jgi:hypothetical protein